MDESWLRAESHRRGLAPLDRLMAIFDFLDQSRRHGKIAELPEPGPERQAIASFIEESALEAGFAEAGRLAQIWLMLIQGVFLAARAGDGDAGRKGKLAAEHVLATWARAGAV